MRITGDDQDGKPLLVYFIAKDEPFPVIATSFKPLSTGVNGKIRKLIVLDQAGADPLQPARP